MAEEGKNPSILDSFPVRRRIGLLGCGTIGSELATAIDQGSIQNATLESVFDVSKSNASLLAARLNRKARQFASFSEFISSDFDLMVEAASQIAVQDYAGQAIASNKDIMIMSVGALSDKKLFEKLISSASKSGHKIYIPSGAIAGIDGIRAVRHLIRNVSLTTTKKPAALAGAPFFERNPVDLNNIRKATVLFDGPAAEAVREFPANVNVAAVLSLAGIGFDRTVVRIIADPLAKNNIHTITATGSFGEIRIEVSNVPSPNNPKTSYLAVLSAIECLRSVCSNRIVIGS